MVARGVCGGRNYTDVQYLEQTIEPRLEPKLNNPLTGADKYATMMDMTSNTSFGTEKARDLPSASFCLPVFKQQRNMLGAPSVYSLPREETIRHW